MNARRSCMVKTTREGGSPSATDHVSRPFELEPDLYLVA
jgi:hypothetical protein